MLIFKVILMVPVESCHTRRMRHLVIVSAPASKPDPAAFSLLTRSANSHQVRQDKDKYKDRRTSRDSFGYQTPNCS